MKSIVMAKGQFLEKARHYLQNDADYQDNFKDDFFTKLMVDYFFEMIDNALFEDKEITLVEYENIQKESEKILNVPNANSLKVIFLMILLEGVCRSIFKEE